MAIAIPSWRLDAIRGITLLLTALVAGSCGQEASDEADMGPSQEGRLVLNEVLVSPAQGETDWAELVVVGDAEVDLQEYSLVDDNPDHTPEILPAARLAPGAFLVIPAVRDPGEEVGYHLTFQLGAADALTLYRGGVAVDTLSWNEGDAPQGSSWGRYPDGTGEAGRMVPTPGAANGQLLDPQPEGTLFVTDRVVELSLELSQADWIAMRADPLSQEYFPAALVFDGMRIENVGLRTKGNSSLRDTIARQTARFPFKVNIDYYVDGQIFLGETMFNLDNGFKDPTGMREHLAYALARELGIPAPRTAFVNLTVNDEHIGLYTLVEQVDTNFLEENFEDDQGDLYKPEPPAGQLLYLGDEADAYPGLDLVTNQDTSDHGAFLELVRILDRGTPDQYASVLDVDRILRFLAVNALLVNLDSYLGTSHNYYLYEQEGVFSLIPWDLNEAFGHFSCGCDRDGLIRFFIDEPTCGPVLARPLVSKLLAVQEYRTTYHGYLSDLIEGPFSPESMEERIDEVADMIRPYVQDDPTTPYTIGQFETSLQEDPGIVSPGGVVIGLGAFVRERVASVADQLDGRSPSTNEGRGGCMPVGGF